jgi:DNA-binding transcriptional regulator YiaG
LQQNPFSVLANESRLSVRALARFLRVRPDTVMHWRKGRREVPEGILNELRAYVAGMIDSDA